MSFQIHTDTCTDVNIGMGIGILISEAIISKSAVDTQQALMKKRSSWNLTMCHTGNSESLMAMPTENEISNFPPHSFYVQPNSSHGVDIQ